MKRRYRLYAGYDILPFMNDDYNLLDSEAGSVMSTILYGDVNQRMSAILVEGTIDVRVKSCSKLGWCECRTIWPTNQVNE